MKKRQRKKSRTRDMQGLTDSLRQAEFTEALCQTIKSDPDLSAYFMALYMRGTEVEETLL